MSCSKQRFLITEYFDSLSALADLIDARNTADIYAKSPIPIKHVDPLESYVPTINLIKEKEKYFLDKINKEENTTDYDLLIKIMNPIYIFFIARIIKLS